MPASPAWFQGHENNIVHMLIAILMYTVSLINAKGNDRLLSDLHRWKPHVFVSLADASHRRRATQVDTC